MSKADILSEVKKAEAAAAKAVKKAESKAQGILSDARAKASGIISDSRTTGQGDAQAIVDAAREAARKAAEKVSAEGERQITGIKESSAGRRAAAVDIVMSSFMAD